MYVGNTFGFLILSRHKSNRKSENTPNIIYTYYTHKILKILRQIVSDSRQKF